MHPVQRYSAKWLAFFFGGGVEQWWIFNFQFFYSVFLDNKASQKIGDSTLSNATKVSPHIYAHKYVVIVKVWYTGMPESPKHYPYSGLHFYNILQAYKIGQTLCFLWLRLIQCIRQVSSFIKKHQISLIYSTAWSKNLLSVCCPPMTKGQN